MPLKTLMIGSIGIAIAFATPASAQDLPAPHMPEEGDSRSDGIRIAQASNGFQLVEHGLWQSALNSTPSNPELYARGSLDRRGRPAPPSLSLPTQDWCRAIRLSTSKLSASHLCR